MQDVPKLEILSTERAGLVLPRGVGEFGGQSTTKSEYPFLDRSSKANDHVDGVEHRLQPKSAHDFLMSEQDENEGEQDPPWIFSAPRKKREKIDLLGARDLSSRNSDQVLGKRNRSTESQNPQDSANPAKHRRIHHDSTMDSFVVRAPPSEERKRKMDQRKLQGVPVSYMQTVCDCSVSIDFSWNACMGVERKLSDMRGTPQKFTWTLLKDGGDLLFFRVTFGSMGLPADASKCTRSMYTDRGTSSMLRISIKRKDAKIDDGVVVDMEELGDMELAEADTHRWFAVCPEWQACVDPKTGALMQLYFSIKDVEMNDSAIKMGRCKWVLSLDETHLITDCVGKRFVPLELCDPDPHIPSTIESHLIPQRTPRWYLARGAQRSKKNDFLKLTCGGSSACSHMGFFAHWTSRVDGARSTYEEKLMIARGQAIFPSNAAMRVGRDTEDEVFMAFLYARRKVTGYEVGWKFLPETALRHMESKEQQDELLKYMHRVGCSPDGLQDDPTMTMDKVPGWVKNEISDYERKHNTKVDITKGVVEIKVSKTTDKMAGYYFPQMLLEMVCFDRWWCDLVKYHVGSGTLAVYRYWFSPRSFRTMILDHILHMFRKTDELRGRKPNWNSWKDVPYSDSKFVMRNQFEGLARKYTNEWRKDLEYTGFRRALQIKQSKDDGFVAKHKQRVAQMYTSMKQRMAGIGERVDELGGAYSVVDREKEEEEHEKLCCALGLLAEDMVALEELSAEVRDCK